MEEEIWKNIVGLEDYQISNLGRVKSVKFGKERFLKFGKDNKGYLHISLCKDGKQKWFLVHRLVYEAFVGEIPESMQINHIDEDKTNNRLDNLNLMTPKENSNWGTRTERQAEKMTNGKCSKQVIQLSLDGVELARFPSTMEVQRQLGFIQQNISRCCNGKRKQAYNYVWKYA